MKYLRCDSNMGHVVWPEQCIHRLRDEHGIYDSCPGRNCPMMRHLTPKEPGKPFRVVTPAGDNNRFKRLDKALKAARPGDFVDVILDGTWESVMHITQDGKVLVGAGLGERATNHVG